MMQRVKASSYVRISIGLWVCSVLLLSIHPLEYYLRAPLQEIDFLSRMDNGGGVSPTLLAVVLIGVVAPIILAVLHRPTRLRTIAAYNQFDYLLPRTKGEFILFAAASVSAGSCEEIIYRGFLIRYFQEAT